MGFNYFFDPNLNKLLSKQYGRRWFETPLWSLWRHCIENIWIFTPEFSAVYSGLVTPHGGTKPFFNQCWLTVSLKFRSRFWWNMNGSDKICSMNGLTHWGRVTHICVGNLTIIGSDNGLSPGRRQAIIWTNAGISWIGPLGTNFSEIVIVIQTFSFKKMHLKISSAKWRPFCLGLNELSDELGDTFSLRYFYFRGIRENIGTLHTRGLAEYPDFVAFALLFVITLLVSLGVKVDQAFNMSI